MQDLEHQAFCRKYPFLNSKQINVIGNARIYKITKDNVEFAIKRMDRSDDEPFAESEMKMHRQLSCLPRYDNYLTRFFDSCITPKEILIAMEYCKHDSIHNFMEDFFPEGLSLLPFADFAEILVEMLTCIEFLHSHNIVHRDIKPDNYLINADGKIKLCDFGFSTNGPEIENPYCGTLDFIAPEIIEVSVLKSPVVCVGSPVDIWAFGISVYELAYGHSPWVEKGFSTQSKLTKEIGKLLLKKYSLPYFDMPTKSIEKLDKLLQKCLAIDLIKRPTAKDMLDKRLDFLENFQGTHFQFLKNFFK